MMRYPPNPDPVQPAQGQHDSLAPLAEERLAFPRQARKATSMIGPSVPRAYERFALKLPLRATPAGPGTAADVDGRTRDLGGGGLKAELAGELPEGTAATLTLWTRWGSVTLQGTVVWRRSAKRGILHGFMFDDPIGDARARELHQEATGPP